MTDDTRTQDATAWRLLHRRSPVLDLLLRPLILATMVGCIAYAVIEALALFLPVSLRYFVGVTVVGGAAGYYVHRFTRVLIPSEAERWRLRLLLLALAFPLVKAVGYLGVSWSTVLADMRSWLLRPYAFFDGRSLWAYLFFVMAWVATANTADDFERIGVRTEDREETPPLLALSARFFVGGAILLMASGLARVGLASLLDLGRASVSGLIANVLLYFVLGLILLGQTRLLALFNRWRIQHVDISPELAGRWLRYSLIFLVIVAVIAFLLPTGYTVPLLDLGRWLLWLLWWVAAFLIFLFNLLLFPLAWLMSLFGAEPAQQPELSMPQPGQLPADNESGLPPWLLLLRSLVFWGVILWIFFTLIRNTLREHPQLAEAVRQIKILRWLHRWLDALWQWLRGVGNSVQETLPRLGLADRLRHRQAEGGPGGFLQPRPASARERVLREYLRTLERAADEGLPRRPPQTPEEYQGTLEPELAEAVGEVSALTASFIEARYSRHSWDAEDARRVREIARRVRAALDRRREDKNADETPDS